VIAARCSLHIDAGSSQRCQVQRAIESTADGAGAVRTEDDGGNILAFPDRITHQLTAAYIPQTQRAVMPLAIRLPAGLNAVAAWPRSRAAQLDSAERPDSPRQHNAPLEIHIASQHALVAGIANQHVELASLCQPAPGAEISRGSRRR
jgi:hypothetical protein